MSLILCPCYVWVFLAVQLIPQLFFPVDFVFQNEVFNQIQLHSATNIFFMEKHWNLYLFIHTDEKWIVD